MGAAAGAELDDAAAHGQMIASSLAAAIAPVIAARFPERFGR